MTTRPFLMGAEVEYSMSCARPGRRSHGATLHDLLLDAIRRDHRWLRDIRTPTGIYLDNGARYYLDCGNHNEFSSPEVRTPREIVAYDRAAELILQRARDSALERHSVNICITKNNINFTVPDGPAWGQHEAYTCWIPLDAAAAPLIPHLVSRIPYAGAGCLSSQPEGMGFELSQRARHMTRTTGMETTSDRAIFCTRAWKRSDVSSAGWTRTNLICKDSQRCSFGMYLSYGVTGLLFMILNEGHRIGDNVQLKHPVAAMRSFSADPWLKTAVRLTNGKRATALDIQREYLREAEPFVNRSDFPDWTREVFEHWAETLDELTSDPMRLSNRLDTYIKLSVFDHQLQRAGTTWSALKQSLRTLGELRNKLPEPVVRAILREDASGLDREQQAAYELQLKKREMRRLDIERLRFAVRLQALELNYHELGGLFDRLDQEGMVKAVVTTPAEVATAIHNPPRDGRAGARGRFVQQLSGQPAWTCDWQYAVNQKDGKWADLRDPFADSYEATDLDPEQLSMSLGRGFGT